MPIGSVGGKRQKHLTIKNKKCSSNPGCGMHSAYKQKRDEALPLGKSTAPEAQPIGLAVGG